MYYAINFPEINFKGIDLFKGSLSIAKERAKKYNCDNVTFEQNDMTTMVVDKNVDCIIAEHSLHETRIFDRRYYCYGPQFERIMENFQHAENSKLIITLEPDCLSSMENLLLSLSSGVGFKNFYAKNFYFSGLRNGSVLLFFANK